jgi:hypothetical protein
MRTPNIAAVLASEMLPKIKNSDFDFTFVINPDFLISSQYDTDEILARLNYEMANCAARCVQLFNENSQSLQEFVNAVNAPENLKNLWVAVDDVLTNLSTERVSDELREILTTKRSEIKFTLDSPQIKFFKSLNSLRHPTSIFSLVEANKDLCKRNSFAALLSKFKFVAVQ